MEAMLSCLRRDTGCEDGVPLVRNPYSCLSSIPVSDLAVSSWSPRRSWWLVVRLPQGGSEASFSSIDQVWNLQPVWIRLNSDHGGEVTTDAGGEKRGKAGSSTAREAVSAG